MFTSDYKTVVFDCDGVILDSNKTKTEAFRLAALPYGAEAAEKLVDHHVALGGVSRYKKFQYFLDSIVPDTEGPGLEELLDSYASFVRQGLMICAVAEGLDNLRAAMPNSRWMIVSGGDQSELREVFAARGLDKLFDGGIFGSPDTKETILGREIETGNIQHPALFFGDSRYDHEAAVIGGLDFVFVSGWSEFSDYKAYAATHSFPVIASLSQAHYNWRLET